MLTKVLCATLLLPFVNSFAIIEDNVEPPVAEPYFIHPMIRRSSSGSRIFRGEEVTPHSYPFQVYLHIVNTTREAMACGGTLISNQWVLTAAHCVVENLDYILVAMGKHDVSATESTEVEMKATKCIIHEGFPGDGLDDDVALVRLPHNVTFTPNIQPVKLASGTNTYVGDQASLIGWGKTEQGTTSNVLKRVNSTIISNSDCAKPEFFKIVM